MSFDDGFILGLSLGGGGSGGTVGTLKAIVDDGAANLSVILTDGSALAEYPYTYIAKLITASVTTSTTSGDTTTTNTKSWSKYLIDKLYDVSGVLVAKAVYSDEEKGIVSHYIDSNDNIIYIDDGYIAEGLETGAELSGADVNSVAIAYAIARNQENAEALQDIKKAYQQGMLNGNGDTTPDYENDDPTPPGLSPIIDENDPEKSDNTAVVGDDGVIDMENGLWHIYTDNNGNITGYVNLYFDGYVYKGYSSAGVLTQYRRNFLHCDAYDASGNLVYKSKYSAQTSGGGAFAYSYVFNGKKITEEHILTKYYLQGNTACADYHHISYSSASGEISGDHYQTIKPYSFSISGSYSKCTNRKPF